jgi:hypothetical protein
MPAAANLLPRPIVDLRPPPDRIQHTRSAIGSYLSSNGPVSRYDLRRTTCFLPTVDGAVHRNNGLPTANPNRLTHIIWQLTLAQEFGARVDTARATTLTLGDVDHLAIEAWRQRVLRGTELSRVLVEAGRTAHEVDTLSDSHPGETQN